MSNFTMQDYEMKLDKQVLHMDQGLSYCPEFRATKMMHDYPSRKVQLARAVYKNELQANNYISKILFKSILSRQGERWQNFGESPEDFTDVMILSRQMMVEKGCSKELIEGFLKMLEQHQGHLYEVEEELDTAWNRFMPVSSESKTYLMLDDATYKHVSNSARSVGEFFKRKNISFYPEIKATFLGWEYFVYGLVDQGTEHLRKLIEYLKNKDIDTIITLTGQAQYVLDVFVRKLGLDHDIKVISILDQIERLEVEEKVYLYAGSFYTRFLRKENTINDLVINLTEERIKNCAEFTPLLNADRRINQVTIWQKPLSAEYAILGIEPSVLEQIKSDAISDIKKGTQDRIIAFEPFAYETLQRHKEVGKVSYYLELIV